MKNINDAFNYYTRTQAAVLFTGRTAGWALCDTGCNWGQLRAYMGPLMVVVKEQTTSDLGNHYQTR